jgi:lipid-binding SYLF domain-containing protein
LCARNSQITGLNRVAEVIGGPARRSDLQQTIKGVPMSIAIRRIGIQVGGSMIAAVLCGSSLPAHASDKSEADTLVAKSRATIEDIAADKHFAAIKPALVKAKAVMIFPQVLRAGFVVGGSGGRGVLLAHEASTGAWIGPAFYTMGSASIGLQAGASSAEMVLVINTQKALDSLYTNKLKLGADATVAIGPMGVEKGASLTADFVVYSKVKGAFAGVALDGSILDVSQSFNAAYYGQPDANPIDILVKRTVINEESKALHAAVAKAEK